MNFRTVGLGSDWSFAKEEGVDANNPTIRNMLRNFIVWKISLQSRNSKETLKIDVLKLYGIK